MASESHFRRLMRAACTVTAFACAGHAFAAETPLITGEQWTKSSEDVMKAFLMGIVNLVQIETAYSGNTPPSAAQSFVPRLVKGRQGPTLDSVREGLNRWHAANPGKLLRPVIETIWFEMAVPGLKK